MAYLTYIIVIVAEIAGGVYLVVHGHPWIGGLLCLGAVWYGGTTEIKGRRIGFSPGGDDAAV